MADIYNNQNQEREKNCARKDQEEADNEQRCMSWLEKDKEENEKGIGLYKQLIAELEEKFLSHIHTYTVAYLKDFIR